MFKNLCVIFQTWPWTIINAFLQRLPSLPRRARCTGNAFWNVEGVASQDWGSLASHVLWIFVPPSPTFNLGSLYLRPCFCWTLRVKPRFKKKKQKNTLETFFPFWPAAQYFSSPGFSPSPSHVTPRPIKLQACVRGSLHSETISMSALTHLTSDCYTISWRKIKQRRASPCPDLTSCLYRHSKWLKA